MLEHPFEGTHRILLHPVNDEISENVPGLRNVTCDEPVGKGRPVTKENVRRKLLP